MQFLIEKESDVIRAHLAITEALNGTVKQEFSLKPYKKGRSLDANAYCWVLLDKIAEILHNTKEEIYKKIIKDVGVFDTVCIQEFAADKLTENWSKKGLGWVADDLGESKIKGCKNICLYYGSSTYTTKEMARFIDEIIQQAKNLNIDTKTPNEIAQLKSLWSN